MPKMDRASVKRGRLLWLNECVAGLFVFCPTVLETGVDGALAAQVFCPPPAARGDARFVEEGPTITFPPLSKGTARIGLFLIIAHCCSVLLRSQSSRLVCHFRVTPSAFETIRTDRIEVKASFESVAGSRMRRS